MKSNLVVNDIVRIRTLVELEREYPLIKSEDGEDYIDLPFHFTAEMDKYVGGRLARVKKIRPLDGLSRIRIELDIYDINVDSIPISGWEYIIPTLRKELSQPLHNLGYMYSEEMLDYPIFLQDIGVDIHCSQVILTTSLNEIV